MAGWYIRRGEKVVGPVELAKLKELAAAGKVLPTDLLAKDVAGPWSAAGKTTLFAQRKSQSLPVPAKPPEVPSTKPVVTVEQAPDATNPDAPSKGMAVVRGGLNVVSAIGKSVAATGGAVGNTLSKRAQRKHEIKLAKIQAQALAAAQAPPATASVRATPVPVTIAPQFVQSTIVKVVNKQGGGCGCSGCGVILLLIFIAIIASVILSDLNQDGSSSSRTSSSSSAAPSATATPNEASSLAGKWTITSTPGWVGKLDPKVQKAFGDMMNAPSPMYTGFYCDGKSTKVYVSRPEWRTLNRFQATNNLTFAVLLPHTDKTIIEYIDDQSGEVLASFTPEQQMGSIRLVHP